MAPAAATTNGGAADITTTRITGARITAEPT
jgi:hypothetical protein